MVLLAEISIRNAFMIISCNGNDSVVVWHNTTIALLLCSRGVQNPKKLDSILAH